jgi:glycosyltransferase involved in cell wall biosynthesis
LKESEVIETPVIIENRDNLKLNEDNLEKGKYIVTYGGMHYRKEIHILVQLIDRILDEFSNMKYVMVGMDDRIFADNRYMSISEYFKLHITRNYDRFVYLGEISDRQRLFSIIKNASICVLPTRIDNLPNTVVESMTLGKVVVSSTSEHGTSVEQLITDGYNGFLAQVDDVEDLYNKIVYALNLPENEKEVIGSRASDRVKKSTPENVYEKMMKIYIETINKKKGSVQ